MGGIGHKVWEHPGGDVSLLLGTYILYSIRIQRAMEPWMEERNVFGTKRTSKLHIEPRWDSNPQRGWYPTVLIPPQKRLKIT